MKRSKKTSKVLDDDEDEDLWDFKSLKRTKKSSVKTTGAKSALPKNKSCRTVAKVAKQRMRSQLENSDTEDSDCLIVDTQHLDLNSKENRRRAFLSNSGINDDLICKSTSSKQTQLLVDKDELSQKLQTDKSPLPQTSGGRKAKGKQSKSRKDPTPIKTKSKDVGMPKVKTPTKKAKSKSSEKNKERVKGTCPFCQVPFSALLRLLPNAHTMECMDLPFLENTAECPDGLSCNSCLPSHYRKYRHTVLAETQAARHTADADEQDVDRTELSEGVISKTLPEDRSVDLTLRLGLGKDDVCIKISCAPKSTSTPSEKNATSTSSKTTSASSIPSSSRHSSTDTSQIDILEGDEQHCDEILSERANQNERKRMSRKNIKGDFMHEKSAKDHDIDQNKVDADDVKAGGFLVLDDNDDDEADKDLAELLADSDDEDDINDTGIDVDNPGRCSRQSDGRRDDDEIDNDIDNTCDTGYDDARSENEMDEDENENVEDGTEIDSDCNENEFTDTQNDDEQDNICDQNNLAVVCHPEGQQINLWDSNSELSQEDKVVPSLARKQTSIFSFFNCPKGKGKGKSVKQTTSDASCDINDLKKGLSKIASVPVLNGSKSDTSLPLKRSASDMTSNRQGNNESSYDATSRGSKRMCPFYKKIPDTSLTVDAFRYGVIPGCRAYVLTHFHYDHYGGLTKHFKQQLYCSRVTGNLVQSKIRVDPRYINTLPLNTPCEVEGVELTLMEANHCPGAVIIVFRLKSGQTFLHTGDFRANPAMEQYPALVDTQIHQLYLDTTYCDPAYSFPPQSEVIDFAVSLAEKHMEACPTSLIVCGSYTIGKERVFIAIAEALKTKICVKKDKKQILDCLEDARLENMVTLSSNAGRVHVLPMGKLNPKNLGDHLSQNSRFTSILAFEPTGWTHSNRVVSLDQIRPKYSRNAITIYGIPYSEHSSYLEMKRFTQFIRPDRILPTVNNGNPQSRNKMEAIFRKWMSEIKNQNSTKKDATQTSKQGSLQSWFK